MNSKVASKPSGLLGPKDNMCVVQMLGPRAQSLSTAVVQFFTCSPQERQWTLRGNYDNFVTLHLIQLFRFFCYKVTGVACLVKDSNRKSYYIQIFDMDIPQRIWEQELYEEFSFKMPKEDVLVFEAELSMVALYFAEIREASDFMQQVHMTPINQIQGYHNRHYF